MHGENFNGESLNQRNYQHDIDLTEAVGRRIGILLAKGNFEGAFLSLRHAVEKELTTIPARLSEMSLSELGDNEDGIWKKTANAIEDGLGIVFLEQLRGVDAETLAVIPNIGERSIELLAEKLRKHRLPFPIPEHFQLPDEPAFDFATYQLPQPTQPTKERPMSTDATRSLVDAICNASEADIEKIDVEIARHQEDIAKLKQVKKVLEKTVKGNPKPKANGYALETPSERVTKYLRDRNNTADRQIIIEDLGMTAQGLASVIRHSGGKLSVTEEGMVILL